MRAGKGFTIVELLIVIVVIAVLAAVGFVAYNGIQVRASDAAVQSDIRQFALKVREFEAIEDRYPIGNSNAAAEGVGKFKLARSAYDSSVRNNFYYCRATVSGSDTFGIVALSISGTVYAYTSGTNSVKELSVSWSEGINSNNICPFVGISASDTDFSFTYGKGVGGWFNWTA